MKGINYRKKPILRGNLGPLLRLDLRVPTATPQELLLLSCWLTRCPAKKVSFLAEQHMDLPENEVYPHMPIFIGK